MLPDKNDEISVMRYADGEMDEKEREDFEKHLKSCDTCRKMLQELTALKEVTDSMKITDLPEVVWDKYWSSIYNRIERSVAWVFFIAGSLILTGYWIYRVITNPDIYTIVGLGVLLFVIGFAVLFLSVLREKNAVNKVDKYISEVKR